MNIRRVIPGIIAWATPLTVLAVSPVGGGEALTLSRIVMLVIDVVNLLITAAMTIAVAMIIYAGFKMATAGGDDNRFKEGKQSLTYAIIGLVVMLGVGIIIRTIANFAVSPTSILR